MINFPRIAALLRAVALFFDSDTRATVAALELRLEELRLEQAEVRRRETELRREMWS